MKPLLAGPLAFVIGLSACRHPEASTAKKVDEAVVADPSAKKESVATPVVAVPVVGDPVVLESAKKVLGCEWDDDEPQYDCEALKEWNTLEALEDGKADSTLIALLDDPDPKMQYIASEGLERHGEEYRKDKAMAEKIFAKAKAAKGTTLFLLNIARLAGTVDAEKTGLGERMKVLAKTLKPTAAREDFINVAQSRNAAVMYETTMDIARNDADPRVRYAAVSSFWMGTPADKHEQVCQLWSDTAHDPEAEVSQQSYAAYLALYDPRDCQNVYEPLLKLLDAKSKTTMDSNSWVLPLYFFVVSDFVRNDERRAGHHKEAMRILKVIAENKSNGDSARADAIAAVAHGDEKNAKAWLAKFKGEPSEWIKSRVALADKGIEESLAGAPKSGERPDGGTAATTPKPVYKGKPYR